MGNKKRREYLFLTGIYRLLFKTVLRPSYVNRGKSVLKFKLMNKSNHLLFYSNLIFYSVSVTTIAFLGYMFGSKLF